MSEIVLTPVTAVGGSVVLVAGGYGLSWLLRRKEAKKTTTKK